MEFLRALPEPKVSFHSRIRIAAGELRPAEAGNGTSTGSVCDAHGIDNWDPGSKGTRKVFSLWQRKKSLLGWRFTINKH